MIKDIKSYLKELGFSKSEAAVYIALSKLGEARASQIAKAADLPRTTAISILNKLAAENYLTTHQYKGVISYWIESPQVMLDLLETKMGIAKKLQAALPNLYRSSGRFPSAKFFDTKQGIKNFIEKTLNGLDKGSVILTIDTPHEGNYTKILTEDFREIIIDLKRKRGIRTNILVPFSSSAIISRDKITSREIKIREMPKNLDFKGSLWLIEDKLINFSGNPPFLSVISQGPIVEGMKAIYRYLWEISGTIDK